MKNDGNNMTMPSVDLFENNRSSIDLLKNEIMYRQPKLVSVD